MTRYKVLLCLAALAVASPAGAAIIIASGSDVTLAGTYGTGEDSGPDFTGTFRYNICTEDFSSCILGPIVPLTWDDRGMTWTVDAANSDTYGVDVTTWQALSDAVADPMWTKERYGFGANPTGGGPLQNSDSTRVIEFDLDRIEFDFVMDMNSKQVYYRLIGTGVVVPEPSCWLLLLALLGCRGLRIAVFHFAICDR